MKYLNRITKKLELILDDDFDITVTEIENKDGCDYFIANIKYKRVNSEVQLRVCNDFCQINIGNEWSKLDNNLPKVMFKLLANIVDVSDYSFNDEFCSDCGALMMCDGDTTYCPKCRELNDY